MENSDTTDPSLSILDFLFAIETSDDELTTEVNRPTSESHRETKERPSRDRQSRNLSVPYTTALQRRQRAELERLRVEVRVLEAHFFRSLRKRGPQLKDASEASRRQWGRLLANATHAKQQSAETDNKALKAILADQQKLQAAMIKVIISITQKRSKNSILCLTFNLKHPVFPAVHSSTVVSLRCERFCRENGRCSIKTSSITPIASSAPHIGDIVWGHAIKEGDANCVFGGVRKQNPSPLEMDTVATLEYGHETIYNICTFRQYANGPQHVLVITIPSATEPEHACIMQNCYQLDVASASIDEAKKMAFNAIGNKMRLLIQSSQDYYLSSQDFGWIEAGQLYK
ncbi:hypothetical protein F443_13971 [Phytophthora nicotianae P1569]|uniref:Uncharacterized protein n=1 Tax=Phytophthora nicotianae P1569 TaxID=1317065 RepID=V9ENC8_PHYNI|nr:hypothetical protein F443_13971 [Phytophthora nicotianae P1569]